MKNNRRLASLTILSILLLGTNAVTFATVHNPNNEQGSTNGQPFNTLKTQLELLESNFDEAIRFLQSQIDVLNVDQDAQDDLISALFTAIDSLDQRIVGLEGRADAQYLLIEALQAQDIFLEQLITALEQNLADLESRVAANEEDIAAIIQADIVTQQLIGAIEANITNLELLINNNAGDITDLNTLLVELDTQLTALIATVATKQDRIAGVCATGSSIREINSDGTVVCEQDDVGSGSLTSLGSALSIQVPGRSIFSTGSLTRSATCPSGYTVTGGGYDIYTGPNTEPRLVLVLSSQRSSNSWQVSVINDNFYISPSPPIIQESGYVLLTISAICVK